MLAKGTCQGHPKCSLMGCAKPEAVKSFLVIRMNNWCVLCKRKEKLTFPNPPFKQCGLHWTLATGGGALNWLALKRAGAT
jgi:hypothetical protein